MILACLLLFIVLPIAVAMSWSGRQVRYLEENDAYVARINRTRLCYYTLKAMLVVSVLATLIFLVLALSTSLIGAFGRDDSLRAHGHVNPCPTAMGSAA